MEQADATTGWLTTFRSLRHRDYRLYFFGQMVSITGYWMQMTAVRWLVYDLTKSNQWVGWVASAQSLPTIFLAGFGGALADRFPRRTLVTVTQSAFLVLTLALTGLVATRLATPGVLLLFAVASGMVQSLDVPARLAFVKEMVGRDDLQNAIALNSLQFNVARILGPWVGGTALAEIGAWPCFLANSLSYLAVVFAFLAMHTRSQGAPGSVDASLRSHLAGVSGLLRQPAPAAVILLAAAVSFFGWPFLELLPALARNHLGVQEEGYSRLLSSTGAGALTAAFLVATFGSDRIRGPALAAGVAAVAVGLIGLSLSGRLLAGVVGSAAVGFGLILFMTTAQSAVQLGVNDEERGRVMGVWAMVWGGMPPLANLIVGPAADAWGEQVVLRFQGGGLLAAALALGVSRWRLRHR